jgi:predicted hydrocarbon binding protein
MSTALDEAPDKPSVKTLQMVWKEGPDWKSVALLKRPHAEQGLHPSIRVVPGHQPYEHNYYTQDAFYRHDPDRGVLRNVYGQRCMRVSEDFMIAMLGSLEDEVGQAGATEIMYKCGYQWGLEDMKSFTRRAQAEFEVALEKMRVGFLLEEWWWPLTITGWGTWRYDFRQKEKGLLYVELYESAVAKSIGDIGAAVCYFYAGMFAAVFSVLARRNLASVEMQCYSMGEDHCKFVIGDYEKVDAAGFWRSQGATAKDIQKKLQNM